jgi:hypothetical protein
VAGAADERDFLVSYVQGDLPWAEWIGWNLEKQGYSVRLEAWDLVVGGHKVARMNHAIINTRHTIAVLSPAYLSSPNVAAEWEAAFQADPDGTKKKLVPVRVVECEPSGLLGGIVLLDLIGLDQDKAREFLLRTASYVREGGSLRPVLEPPWPGLWAPEPPAPSTPAAPGPAAPGPAAAKPAAAVSQPASSPGGIADAISRPAAPGDPIAPADREVGGETEPPFPSPAPRWRQWVGVAVTLVAIVVVVAGITRQASGRVGGGVAGPLAVAAAAAVLSLVVFPPGWNPADGAEGGRDQATASRARVLTIACTAVAALVGAVIAAVGAHAAGYGPAVSVIGEAVAALALGASYARLLRPRAPDRQAPDQA